MESGKRESGKGESAEFQPTIQILHPLSRSLAFRPHLSSLRRQFVEKGADRFNRPARIALKEEMRTFDHGDFHGRLQLPDLIERLGTDELIFRRL